MAFIQKSVTINAPADTVLAVIENPDKQSELNPNLKLLSHTPSPVGLFDSKWEFKMAGKTFAGDSTMVAYEKGKRIVYESKGGIDSRWEWTINSQGSTTEVSLTLNYTLPGSFLGAAVDKLMIERQNEKDVENQLANLKRLSEN